MYRLSRLKYVFPLGLFVALFLDGSFSKIFAPLMFSYPYSMSSQLVMLWLVLSFFLEENIHIPLVWFAVLAGAVADLYYSGILGLFIFLYPLIILLTRALDRLLDRNFLNMILIFFIDLVVFESLNYLAYRIIGVIHQGFGDFLVDSLAPTLALNLVYFVIFFWPVSRIYHWALSKRRRA
ncbi:rod shape-determining protein MreD [[Lactobacillus] timonensis]|uniref:rod shape-determining protein MreD n=1 Tax=[Lactobacillus] timonensis TaxID=1970790 RepID=UPI000C81C471|nr:rod shape-determining protein MreD [[Lactobacillus] timonensis]